MTEFSIAAFNAHWGHGRFGRFRGVRFDIARLVRSFDADVVVVPESYRDVGGPGSLDSLCDDGYRVETIEFMHLDLRPRTRFADRDAVPYEGIWELAVCSRLPVLSQRRIPIGHVPSDPPGPRDALALTVDVAGTPVEVIGLHTSSKVWRLAPLQHLHGLKRRLSRTADGPQVIAGDFNFWGPGVGALMRGWARPVRGRTYPAPRPHSQIDHILVRGGVEGISGDVLAATPSDHRPVRARLRLGSAVT